jgi:hypothetical protein
MHNALKLPIDHAGSLRKPLPNPGIYGLGDAQGSLIAKQEQGKFFFSKKTLGDS